MRGRSFTALTLTLSAMLRNTLVWLVNSVSCRLVRQVRGLQG